MKKVRINKKVVALLLAAGIGTGVISFSLSKKMRNDSIGEGMENSIGYTNINPVYNFKVYPEDFVILDVGDHDSIGVHFQGKKMKMCNNQDISLGIEISSSAEDEADIYDDALYAKSVLEEYDVSFPVFLNIDKIVGNDNLSTKEREILINDFIRKCQENHIIVGISGTDTNLSRLVKNCVIDDCKKFLIMDDQIIKYPDRDSLDLIKDLDGIVSSTWHYLSEDVNEKDNNSKYFVNDYSYIVQKDDDILDIAMTAKMSVDDLLEYNSMKKRDIVSGTVLKIPTKKEIRQYKGLEDFEVLDEAIRGCDLSLYQDGEINWEKMAENFDFAILRCSTGLDVDPTFEVNALNCSLYNIPIGVYCYNEVDNTNMLNSEEFAKRLANQTEIVLNSLKEKEVSYPVYLCLEYEDGAKGHFTKAQVKKMVENWATDIREVGYIPGICCTQKDYEFLQSCVDYPVSDVLQVWITGEKDYSTAIEVEDTKPLEFLGSSEYNASIACSTKAGVNAGAGNVDGYLDVNYSVVDYIHIPIDKDNYSNKEFKRPDWLLLGGGLGLIVLVNSSLAISDFLKKIKAPTKKKNTIK